MIWQMIGVTSWNASSYQVTLENIAFTVFLPARIKEAFKTDEQVEALNESAKFMKYLGLPDSKSKSPLLQFYTEMPV